MPKAKERRHPIERVAWVHRDLLIANDYNPNSQADHSYDLLRESIIKDGWTQPIVVRPAGPDNRHVIVDGEHRWRASQGLGDEKIPIVVLEADQAGCIAATVRHNRARGAHGVESMVHIVKRLRAEGQGDEEIEAMLGMKPEERKRLETSEEAFLALMSGKDSTMG